MPFEPLPTNGGHEPSPIGLSLDRVVRHLGGPSARTVSRLHALWSEIVGDQVAEHAEPGAVHDGVLRVYVDDPAWATQLRFLEGQIVERVRAVVGGDEVRSVEVRVRAPRA